MSEQIFLSHRRSDGWYTARLLKFYMKECGLVAFVDNQIERSAEFDIELKKKIMHCDDFILLLTKDVVEHVITSKSTSPIDYVFEEMLVAYEAMKAATPDGKAPKLHIFSKSREITTRFTELKLPKHYSKYKDAYAYFRKLTVRDIDINFEGVSDEKIISDIKTIIPHLQSNPRRAINRQILPSGYGAKADKKEYARLDSQSKISYKYDEPIMNVIEDRLMAREGFEGKKIHVLDVGCANGSTGYRYFCDDAVYGQILGIDCQAVPIAEACKTKREKGYQRFHYMQLDVTDPNFEDKLDAFRSEHLGNDMFDIVFCYQVLQHIPSSKRKAVVDSLVENLSEGGCLVIRGSDDGTKMFYHSVAQEEDHNLISDIVELTTSLPRMADRYYGRKIYSDLKNADLSDITVQPITCSTSGDGVSETEINSAFKISFGWRSDAFKPDKNDSTEVQNDMKKKEDRMNKMVLRLKGCVTSGWYMETDFLGYGFKKSDNF